VVFDKNIFLNSFSNKL